MERNDIMLSFKGYVTSDLLTSILQIMENKLENIAEQPKVRKKVFNVLVECLQNLYHHIEADEEQISKEDRTALFMVGKKEDAFSVITGNYIHKDNVEDLKSRIDEVNQMDKAQLKEYYKQVLNNGEMSKKGGGGLGIIDIARKSGQKLTYDFKPVDGENYFFSLHVKIAQ